MNKDMVITRINTVWKTGVAAVRSMPLDRFDIKRALIVFVLVNFAIMSIYGYLHFSQSEVAYAAKPAVKPAAAAPVVPVSADAAWNTLRQRQDELRIKEMELRTLESELNAKLRKLDELEAVIRQDVSALKTLSDERIKHLVKIYTSMNPKAAAKLMDTMDLLVAVEVFHNMKGEVAGGILANMEPVKAASITKMLASYRAATKQAATP